MINPATQPIPEWNEFTEYLRDHPGTTVIMRCGYSVKPMFSKAEGKYFSDRFYDKNHHWYTNGKSVTSSDFDMMSLVI